MSLSLQTAWRMSSRMEVHISLGSFTSSMDKLLWYGFTVYIIIAPHLNEKMAIHVCKCSYDFSELQTRRRFMVQWLIRRTTSSGKMVALSVRKISFKSQENTSLCSLKRYIVIYLYYRDNELSCMSAEQLGNLIMTIHVLYMYVVIG